MSGILYGKPVADSLREGLRCRIARCREAGIEPVLATVRAGDDPGGLSYERSIRRACDALGITVLMQLLPADCTTEELAACLSALSADTEVHGILLLRPLPVGVDEQTAAEAIAPEKDVDGVTSQSLRRVFTGYGPGHCPCTPEAVLTMLDYYGIEPAGKRVTVVGRSLIVGKPLTLLLTGRDATVTLCHRRTRDLPALCREADILVVAAGSAGLIGPEHVRDGQTVIDVGTSPDAKGRLSGDVRFDEVLSIVRAVSPVPGGVGAVTSAVLLEHTVSSAERTLPDL